MKKLTYILFFILFCFSRIVLAAQNNNNPIIDSLQNQLNKQMEDSVRCDVLIELSKQLSQTGNYNQAEEYATKVLEIANTKNLQKRKGFAYIIIGASHFFQGNYAKAIENYTKALKIYEDLDDKKGIASSLNNIGGIYLEQKEYDQALKVYLKSLDIKKQINDKKGIAMSYHNMANIYYFKENYAKSLEYNKQSLEIREELGSQSGIALSLNNIGSIYAKQGEYTTAITYFNKSLKIDEEAGNKQGVASSLRNLADIYFHQKNTKKALEYGKKAMNIANEIGVAIETRDVSKLLVEIYKETQQHKEALIMFDLYIKTRDSILSEENQKEVIRQEYKYNYDKKAAADSVANAKANEIRDAQIAQQNAELKAKRNQQLALFGGLALVLVFAGFMFNRFKITQKQKLEIELAHQQLEEKNEEIIASIRYAKRIQDALLTSQKYIERNINRLKNQTN
ncbi:MAG: tetratricopeptide repeat protein [Flavobacteriales bacterium]|nr:tetratricopeptide repeat protein [Flavobacteriales bacterium]